jgi:hypothetical protein
MGASVAAFMKSLSRLLGGSPKLEPAVYLAAFGKHPGWNDHLDDQGLDTSELINAKRLLYVQGISQNIDAGAWENLDPQDPNAPLAAVSRLDQFLHDFLWHMPTPDGPVLLAGRLWSSSDGKGRSKYPMVLCTQITALPDRFASQVALPFLVKVHEQCVAATTADAVQQTIQTQRDALRARMKDAPANDLLTARQLAAVARHDDMCSSDPGSSSRGGAGGGFHRIIYQFVKAMSAFRLHAANGTKRPEQVRVPTCGMCPADALLFWLRLSLTLLDPATSLLLLAPDQPRAPWVDLIAGEPSPANLFCIKAGPKNLPFTSDIPYTLDPSLVRTIDAQVKACAELAEDAGVPAWPSF